jgi:hypothetical protein
MGVLLAGCGGDRVPDAEIRVVNGYHGFVADKGNIGCVMDAQAVRCDINKRAWKPPKDTKKCELDYGHGIWLESGGAPQFVCSGDTTLYAGSDLASGHGIRTGDMTCVVRRQMVTCADDEGGRGFEISAKRYRLF